MGSTLLFPARALFVFDIVALLLSLSLSVWIASMPPKNLKRLAPVVVVPKVNEFIFSPCMLRHWLTSSLAICDPLGPTFSFPARPLHVRNLAAFFFMFLIDFRLDRHDVVLGMGRSVFRCVVIMIANYYVV